MYRVTYYTGCFAIVHKEFEKYDEASKFALSLPIESVLEIKFHKKESSEEYSK